MEPLAADLSRVLEWTSDEVGDWLERQLLGQYREKFIRENIAGDILFDLTVSDLAELGLTLGDRKRFLRGIRGLSTRVHGSVGSTLSDGSTAVMSEGGGVGTPTVGNIKWNGLISSGSGGGYGGGVGSSPGSFEPVPEGSISRSSPLFFGDPLFSSDHASVGGYPDGDAGLDLAFLFSSPLVVRSQSGNMIPLQPIDVDSEQKLLKESLGEARRQISVRFDAATTRNFGTVIRMGCKVLHFSGHGTTDGVLLFESNTGGAQVVSAATLRDLLCIDGRRVVSMVFVSSCYSEHVGEAFVAAGVPHVVVARRKVMEKAARYFCHSFYHGLLNGMTVQESFHHGRWAVENSPDVQNASFEASTFDLLPRDGDHSVPMFPHAQVGAWHDITPSSRPTRCPLPADSFTGRRKEMYSCTSNLLKAGSRVTAIYGSAGLGKTSLALMVGHYISERRLFQDGVYYIDMGGLTTSDAISYSVAHTLSIDIESDRDLFESMRSLECLLIMDGCEKALKNIQTDFEKFLVKVLERTSKVKILLVSRQSIDLESHAVLGKVDLSPMSEEESVVLLKRMSRRLNGSAGPVRKIAELCGYCPLAMRVVARTLEIRSDLTVDDLVARISDDDKRLGMCEYEACIRPSYDGLSPSMKRMLRCLAVFPGMFDQAAASFLLDVDAETTDSLMGDLLKNKLIENSSRGRYYMQDLLRLFLQNEQLKGAGQDSTGVPNNDRKEQLLAWRWRFCVHYLFIVESTNGQLIGKKGSFKMALQMFDSERHNIECALGWMEEYSREKDFKINVDATAETISRPLGDVQYRRASLLQWVEDGLSVSMIVDGQSWANLLRSFALCCEEVFRLRLSAERRIKWFSGIAHMFKETEKEYMQIGQALILSHLDNGDHKSAESLLTKVLDLRTEHSYPDLDRQISNLSTLAELQQKRGSTEDAVRTVEQALALCQANKDKSWSTLHEAKCLNNLAGLQEDQKKFDEAVVLYQKCIKVYREELGDHMKVAEAISNLAIVTRRLGNTDRAITLFEEALSKMNELGLSKALSTAAVMNNLAATYLSQNSLERAHSMFKKVLEISEEAGWSRHPIVASVRKNMGDLMLRLGDKVAARELYCAALELRKEVFGAEHSRVVTLEEEIAKLDNDVKTSNS